MSCAHDIMDMGEEGGGYVDPVVTVREHIVVVAESMCEVFVDSLESMVVCSANVCRREIARDYGVNGHWVNSGDGLFDGGYSEARGNRHGGVGCAGDVC